MSDKKTTLRITGKVMSPGLAEGRTFVHRDMFRHPDAPVAIETENIEQEFGHLEDATAMITGDLLVLATRVEKEMDSRLAAVFETHQLMLNDPALKEELRAEIRENLVSASSAVKAVFLRWEQRFLLMESQMARQKGDDMRDISNRLSNALAGIKIHPLEQIPPGSVLAASRLLHGRVIPHSQIPVHGVIFSQRKKRNPKKEIVRVPTMKYLLKTFQPTVETSRNNRKQEEIKMKTNQSWTLAVNQIKRICTGLVLTTGVMLTQPVLAAGPSPVNLLSTARFTILSGAAITTTGGGTIDGDVGASPITGAAILLNASQVNGTIYCVDNTGPAGSVRDPDMLTVAKNDLTKAYNEARDRVPVPTGAFLNPGAGNIGGLVLVPGLYKFTGQALLSGSDVTLNGGPDDVWIFQIATELIVEAGVNRSVILAGGAQAKNIFWQVGTSATLGTFCNFKGTILADQAITMDTSSTMEGRALAFSAQVAFNGTGASIPTSSQVITNFIPTNASVFVAATIDL